MYSLHDYFNSVGDVWVIWLISALGVFALTWRALTFLKKNWFKVLLVEERGAAYALPYMLQFPVYVMLVCTMIQSSIILMVKMGTLHASYSAARAAIVWRSAQTKNAPSHETALEKASWAARFAMTPFASSYKFHFDRVFSGKKPLPGVVAMAQHYYYAYRHIARDNIKRDKVEPVRYIPDPKELFPEKGVLTKFYYAYYATSTSVSGRREPDYWNKEITATVDFTMPMHVPVAGRWFSNGSVNGVHVRKITSSTTLPSEAPRTDRPNGRIGIPYRSE